MTRYFYDSTVAANIPADAAGVCGYCDGLYVWSASDWARFPNAVKVRIAVNPATNDGHVLDTEPGNWDAAASVDWVLMRRASGLATPTVYCGSWAPGYTWQDVLNAHAARGIDPPLIWYANYSTGPNIPAGAIAHQYAAMATYDLSIVADYWSSVDIEPTPPQPDPQPGPDVSSAQGRIASAITDLQAAQQDLNA
jgi:hypothetical protein